MPCRFCSGRVKIATLFPSGTNSFTGVVLIGHIGAMIPIVVRQHGTVILVLEGLGLLQKAGSGNLI